MQGDSWERAGAIAAAILGACIRAFMFGLFGALGVLVAFHVAGQSW